MSAQLESSSNTSTARERVSGLPLGLPAALVVLIAFLVAARIVYHVAYLTHDPFALVTISDGQLYEDAARDIVAHPPLGTQALYLQGLYAYVLAAGIAVHDSALSGLLLQLVLCSLACAWLARATLLRLGPVAGGLSVVVLLAYPSLAFYENKYLSVAIGVACNMAVLAAFVQASAKLTRGSALLLGLASGASLLGRPNLLLAVPFTLFALAWLARAQAQRALPLLAACLLGLVIAVAPLALRNQLVTGTPDVFPSHGGGVPFYIGNNPHANGRWNDAGGLLSGQVLRERGEIARRLGLTETGAALDAAVGRTLYGMAFTFIREQPTAWLTLELKKLWYALGDHAFIRDYDLFGERELLGWLAPVGLPFGALLGLGVLGVWVLWQGGGELEERELLTQRALCLVLLGQLCAVLIANVLWFSSAQNRVPLAVPLAFASGPALVSIVRRSSPGTWLAQSAQLPAASTPMLFLACVLFSQALWPRMDTYRPSSVHYYNLATVEEQLGRTDQALTHYRVAAQRSPTQAMFLLRLAHLARLARHDAEARTTFEKLLQLPIVDPAIRAAAQHELQSLAQAHH